MESEGSQTEMLHLRKLQGQSDADGTTGVYIYMYQVGEICIVHTVVYTIQQKLSQRERGNASFLYTLSGWHKIYTVYIVNN